jgi:hypothetical protein
MGGGWRGDGRGARSEERGEMGGGWRLGLDDDARHRPLAERHEHARADAWIGHVVRNEIREHAESRDGNGDGDGPHRRLVYAAF